MKRARLPKAKKGPKADLLLVEWVDSHGSGRWLGAGDARSLTSINCFSVGWVLQETAEIIQLAASVSVDESDSFDQVTGMIIIPKVSIIRHKVLARGRL